MPNKLGAALLPHHRKLYRRVLWLEAGLSLGEQLLRLVLIAVGAVVMALVLPFIPSRHSGFEIPDTMEEYAPKLLASLGLLVLLFGYGVYQFLLKPHRNRQAGYQLVGEFDVRRKTSVLGAMWLELAPDETHRVSVPARLYASLSPGDRVEVRYSASYDLLSIRKVSGLPANTTV
ncbi:hypothetical protein LGH70_17320 [Hymenobacter sp. BT635]|uniref:DUF3592 domain-containing protein n=1 Tax=Hymenobacter nitidus TaxID=2880929 RepID=A0ABS8AI49_9BACT|nr:hypothetical protein [Hymenobacter nitidus]MCB2379362.1 hypothetical protein [Hymenobacter nitidus]